MTLNSTLRAISAASRRIERERGRQHRLALKQQAVAERRYQEAIDANAVEEFNELIESLEGVGRACGERIDWEAEANCPNPPPPLRTSVSEDEARKALHRYRPGIVDRVTKRAQKMRDALAAGIILAKEKDDQIFVHRQAKYQTALQEVLERQALASRVLKGDLEVYKEVLQELGPFQSMSEVGSHIGFSFHGPFKCSMELETKGDEIVPGKTLSLTARGRLSEKAMPIGRKWELYQDYVCGSLFRMAREISSLLPVKFVVCSAYCEILDTSTGRRVRQCICSAGFPIAEFDGIDFEHVDFSDALSRFRHNMKFSKRSGFTPVEALSLDDFDLSWVELV